MISVLAEYTGIVVKYIIEKALDSGKNKLERRRDLLAKLLVLYNKTQNLRIVSEAVMQEFSGYDAKLETPTKIVSAKQLKELLGAFKEFQEVSRDLSKFLEIYSLDIGGFISRARHIKMAFFWKLIDVTEYVVPVMKEVDGRKTFTLVYPTSLPSFERVDRIDASIASNEDLEAKSAVFRDFLLNPFNFVEVEINGVDLSQALSGSREAIEVMSNLEAELRAFMKANFSIDRIFEATS
ncbi:hypothetical protein [Pararhizobium sp. LjRoot238]|uniref:hypothetical protein n=1 Tax=Pararhizobium sp. LjRoot238 TaxID=3342293 RepID=UPI003ED12845